MSWEDDIGQLRNEADPLKRGKIASELIVLYQQRGHELARLRRDSIEEAKQSGMTYTQVAAALGLTTGRITQIKQGAPKRDRIFFGVGPVALGIPYRYTTTDRERPLIAAEDSATADRLENLLSELSFTTKRFQIEPTTEAAPEGDRIVVCGPKSAPLGASLMNSDPVARFEKIERQWWFKGPEGVQLSSKSDASHPESKDLGYLSRRVDSSGVTIHVAGIHAIGSLGVAHYLEHHLSELARDVGNESFTCAVESTYDGLKITKSNLAAGPFKWDV